MCENRRKVVTKDGKETLIQDVSLVQHWSEDLKVMPNICTGDIMIYFLSTCQWSEDRLKRYKQDNGYKLYENNHVSDVQLHKTEHDFLYVRGKCVPETRQSSDPYSSWILVDATGYIKSGGCTCVADDVVALLFSCNSFTNRHIDRHTSTGTDIKCSWDQPKTESKPSEINDLLYYNEKPDLKHTYAPLKKRDCHPTENLKNRSINYAKEHEIG